MARKPRKAAQDQNKTGYERNDRKESKKINNVNWGGSGYTGDTMQPAGGSDPIDIFGIIGKREYKKRNYKLEKRK